MSIEIYRKGFRLDIKPEQVVTFKKSQNLNGVQNLYSYSNTIQLEDTANNRKLLELFPLPTSKVASLMNGYEADIVLNGSINLRNQTLKIQKEGKDKIETYLLYNDNILVSTLKKTYINTVAKDYLYKKNISDFIEFSAFMETQPKSGLFVMEEIPRLINLQELVIKMFTQNAYSVFGDFSVANSLFSEYFIAPNKGVYRIYSGAGEGFAPSFDSDLDAYTFLNSVLALFNCYADVDDNLKTVIINKWSNLSNFKTDYADYSKKYIDYEEYSFQSKLSKKNLLTYSDSGTAYNSFFTNNLSSEKESTYLNSDFGTGALNIFDDSKIETSGVIPLRLNGEAGDVSSIKLFKKTEATITANIFIGGAATPVTNVQAAPVSMLTIYTDFHKEYTDFILTPLLGKFKFKYDDILAAGFSMTKVFFVEQLASYWIPLEINFSTKKDIFSAKAMLVKKRKIESPILYNFNSVLLDFKEKAAFPIASLLSMYPIPPNKAEWETVIFKSYDQDLNKLYINDILITAASLPQAFNISDIVSIKFEANKAADTVADTNTDSFIVQAIDTNGGTSNTAYITVKHTGVASLESNFAQTEEYAYSRGDFDRGDVIVSPNVYYLGPKPNLNDTVLQTETKVLDGTWIPDDSFNLAISNDSYTDVKIEIPSFPIYLRTKNGGIGKARATATVKIFDGVNTFNLYQVSSADNNEATFTVPKLTHNITAFGTGKKLRVYIHYFFDNRRGSNSGSMDVWTTINNFKVNISTIKTI